MNYTYTHAAENKNASKPQKVISHYAKTRFGEVMYAEDTQIFFSKGLYGFPEYQYFYLSLLESVDPRHFQVLLNIKDPSVSFVLTPLDQPNGLLIAPKDLQEAYDALQLNMKEIESFAVTTLRKSQQSVGMSVNLKAPIIIDHTNRKGWQFILEKSNYPVRHIIEAQIME